MKYESTLKSFSPENYTNFINGKDISIQCPVCGFEYQHIIDTQITPGLDSYKAWPGRGDCCIVFVKGECGCRWNLCFGEHKGYITTWVEIIESCEEETLPTNVKFTKNERNWINHLITHPAELRLKSIVDDPMVRVISRKLKLWSEEDD